MSSQDGNDSALPRPRYLVILVGLYCPLDPQKFVYLHILRSVD